MRRFLPVLLVALAADQLSKAWARGALAGGPLPVLDDTLYFRLGLNPGIAFSLLTGANARVLLAVAGLGVAVGMAIWVARSGAPALGPALIAAGAAGNAVDRIHVGAVTDFVVIQIGSYRWPTFNVADAALVIGVIWLATRGTRRDRSPAPR